MRFIVLLAWLISAHLGFGQNWNPAYKKGSLYFFSTYYTDSTLTHRMEGKHVEEHQDYRAVRIFENGHLIQEQKWNRNIQTHDYHIRQKSPFSALYTVWDSLGRINERWELKESKDHHRILQISVFYPNGKSMLRFEYTQLTEKEQLEFQPEGYNSNDIDEGGFSPILVPTGISEEKNEHGTLISRKEYRFDPRPISEEERRMGRYILNYPNGKPWEIHDYPTSNPFRGLHPFQIFYEDGHLQSELSLSNNGKATKSEYYSNGKLSMTQKITNHNHVPNQNTTRWFSPSGQCYRMRNEDPSADTIEYEKTEFNQYRYLQTQKAGVIYTQINDVLGNPLKRQVMLSDSTFLEENFKNNSLINKIERKGYLEKVVVLENNGKKIQFTRIDGKIEGSLTIYKNDTLLDKIMYYQGICHREYPINPATTEITGTADSLYKNANRQENYYPFTLCIKDTQSAKNAALQALSRFESDWKQHIRYHWQMQMDNQPIAQIHWARGLDFTMIEIIGRMQSPVYLIYYDNGYREFLNLEKTWDDLTPLVFLFKMDLLDQD